MMKTVVQPEDMSFEECVTELSAINRRLVDRDIGIEDALAQVERGMRLSSRAAEVLARARIRVSELEEAMGLREVEVTSGEKR